LPDLNFRIGADIRPLQSAINQARREITRGLGSIGGVGGLLTGAGVAAGLQKAVTDHVQRATEIAKLAQLANASIAEASRLLATGEQFGATGDLMAAAMKNVASAAATQPELFKAIGVATTDATGAGRRNIDMFNDLRKVLSTGANDYKTVAAATDILKKSTGDLYPFLRATETQVQAVAAAAADMGLVMSEDDVAAALAFAGSMKVAEAQGSALSQMIATALIPKLADLTEAAFTAGDMLQQLFTQAPKGGLLNDVPILGGLQNFVTNSIDILAGNPTDSLRRINDVVNQRAKIRADFARLAGANLLNPGGGSFEFPTPGGKGRDAVADAMHDRIDAIKETAKAQEQATRDALQNYEREKQGIIDATTAEKDVVRSGFDERIRQIQDLADAEDQAHQMRDRAHEDAINALREQVRGTQELVDLERSRADVADAEAAAASERSVEIFRGAGQSANDYGRAVRDQQKRIADADKRVAETKKKLEQDTAKSGIEARIRAIETERAADARLMEDKKAASAELLKNTRRQMDEEQAAYQARIDGMQAELKAEQQRVGDIIEAESRKTDAIVLDLEKELKEHTRVAAAVGAAWDFATRPRQIVITATGDAAAISAVAAGASGTGPRMGGIREFASGGIVPGPIGAPMLAKVHGGEEIRTPAQQGGSGATSVINAYGIGVNEAARLIARENERMLARRAARGHGRRR
jgi:hypothetical protein